jgi:hypothetical protein
MAEIDYTPNAMEVEEYSDDKGHSSEHFNHIKKVNDVFYDQVKSADQKAAYIFTFMLAFLVTSTEGQGVFTWSRYASGDLLWGVISAILAISMVISILCAILVVIPRRVESGTSLFWGAWAIQRKGLVDATAAGDMAYLFNQYLKNADAMAKLALDKYRMVRFAFRGLLMTVLAYVLLLVARH